MQKLTVVCFNLNVYEFLFTLLYFYVFTLCTNPQVLRVLKPMNSNLREIIKILIYYMHKIYELVNLAL